MQVDNCQPDSISNQCKQTNTILAGRKKTIKLVEGLKNVDSLSVKVANHDYSYNKKSLFKRSSLLATVLLLAAVNTSYAAEVYGTITANNPVLWNNAATNSYFGSEAISPSAWTIAQERTNCRVVPGHNG